MYERYSKEKAQEYNTRAYAKRLGITVEELMSRRQEAADLRELRKSEPRRRRQKTIIAKPTKPKKLSFPKKRDLWWERLKKKHAKHKGTRLEKSIKPPVLLNLPEDVAS